MNQLRVGVILALFLSSLAFSACVGGNKNANLRPAGKAENTGGENVNTAKTNVEELSLLVKVPYEAEDIVWKEDTTHKRVVAVLRFSPTDASKIVAEAEKFGTPENVNNAAETWFPDELIAQSEMSSDNALKGMAYDANSFYLEPYTAGKITRIDGSDYFVLELSAK